MMMDSCPEMEEIHDDRVPMEEIHDDKVPLNANYNGVLSSSPTAGLQNAYSNGIRHFEGFLHPSHCHSVIYSAVRFLRIIVGSKLAWFLPAVVLSFVSKVVGWPEACVFTFSLVAIVPLAERLGYVTEQLAIYTSPTVGGLLNATFGNATEVIISVFALKNGLIRVVQLSLLGSILSNMLLVLGSAFFLGGIRHKEQTFNQATAAVNSSLLLMAVMAILFPATLHATHTEVHDGVSELFLSRFTSCIMLLAYVTYLYFQLKSHKELYNEEEEIGSDSVEEELSQWGCVLWLAILTVFIALLSNYLVIAIEGTSKSLNISLACISVIILPIVGNAAEHASAIMFAMKDKLDISVGVAVGSSTQISMFVIPFCVILGWIMGVQMDLNFQLFETATLFTAVIVVAFMLQEGRANYFKGLMLVLCYAIVGASFFVHSDISSQGKVNEGMKSNVSLNYS